MCKKNKTRVKQFFLIGLLSLLALSCRQNLGYGVVLWSPDDVMIATGSVVKVKSQIDRKGVYRVEQIAGSDETLEIDTWRLELFKSLKQAEEYARSYAFFTRNFVENELAGLPLRLEPSTSSPSDYKLEEGQQLKVLSHTKTREQIGSYKSYWYYLLSSDGEKGWVYGRYLRGYILSDTGVPIYDESGYLGDALLENFFNSSISWRPLYFKEMMAQGQLNLNYFKSEYGLFVDSNRKVINLNLPNLRGNYSYKQIVPVGGGNYFFEGSNFSFLISETEVVARFTHNGVKYKETFVPIKNDQITPSINNEMNRRAGLYRLFINLGGSFTSNWGTLNFSGNQRFTLTNSYSFVDNGYLRNSDGNAGEVRFDVLVTGDLAKKYDGGFSLVFDNSGRQLNFVYSMTSKGFVARIVDNLPLNRTLSSEIQLGLAPSLVFTS